MCPCKDTLLARPVAVKALREHSEREQEREREKRKRKRSGESDKHQEYFRSIKDYKLEGWGDRARCRGQCVAASTGRLGLGTGPESAVVRKAQTWDRPAT